MRPALFSCAVATLAIQQAVSIPFDERAASNSGMYNILIFHVFISLECLDTHIVQFALTLEHLEVAFYARGLALFNDSAFKDANFTPIIRRRFEEIFEHEQAHVALLTKALGDQAPQPCDYSLCVFLE